MLELFFKDAYIRNFMVSAFLPTYPTPMSLFNSVSKDNPIIIHSTWLELLRENLEQNQMQRRNDTIRRSLEETLEKGMLGFFFFFFFFFYESLYMMHTGHTITTQLIPVCALLNTTTSI